MKRTLILLAAVLGAVVLYIDLSGTKFRERIERERSMILENRTAAQTIASASRDFTSLPLAVQKYLRFALGERSKPIASVRIKQSGSFRLEEKDAWTPVTADQLLATGQPAFVWHARLQPHPYVWTESRDLLHEGTGRTEHRLYSAFPFPLQRFAGKAADVSALVRYLTEAPWLPAALLPSKHLSWTAIDASTARATLSINGYQAIADFTFNKQGEIVRVTTQDRALHRPGSAERHLWSARYQRYELHDGINVPMEMESEWNIDGRSFPYARLQVDAIEFRKM